MLLMFSLERICRKNVTARDEKKICTVDQCHFLNGLENVHKIGQIRRKDRESRGISSFEYIQDRCKF